MFFHEQAINIAMNQNVKEARAAGQPKTKSQPNELLLFEELTNDLSDYQIEFSHERQVAVSPLARGLKDRNGFDAAAMCIGMVSVPIVSAKLMWGAHSVHFFPNPNIFSIPKGSANLSEAQALEGVYWGNFTLQTNEGVRIDSQPLRRFRTANRGQAGTVLSTDGTDTGSQVLTDEVTGNEYKSLGGIYQVMGGDDNYLKIHIKCLDKTHLAGNTDRKNYLMIGLLGAEGKGKVTSAYTNR